MIYGLLIPYDNHAPRPLIIEDAIFINYLDNIAEFCISIRVLNILDLIKIYMNTTEDIPELTMQYQFWMYSSSHFIIDSQKSVI